MAQKLNQPLSTLQNIILASAIKLGLMPWLTWLVRTYIQVQPQNSSHPNAIKTISENSTDTDEVQDYTVGSTWYAWFDDNINDFYTADPAEADQPLDPTDLVTTLIANQVTLWHHPEFAPWLVALTEPAFYQWPAEISCETELTTPQQVRSPETQRQLTQALSSLPAELIHDIHIQELALMYLGTSYNVLEQLAQTPLAQKTRKERERHHQELYAKSVGNIPNRN